MTTDSSTRRPEAPRERVEDSTDAAELTPNQVVVALLQQQETLLAELSWAYEQLERSQQSEIAELRSRVSSLEYRVAKKGKGQSIPPNHAGSIRPSFLSVTRKRVDFTVRHPQMAMKAARRRLRRSESAPMTETGLTK